VDPAATLTPERLLRRLEWRIVRRLDGRLQGDYRTLFRGAGVDFTDLREYEPGDDLRHIDWNVTARMDAPYVRQYVEDRELTAWLLWTTPHRWVSGRSTGRRTWSWRRSPRHWPTSWREGETGSAPCCSAVRWSR
jgi:uncharacterized protein (DUF58 family)